MIQSRLLESGPGNSRLLAVELGRKQLKSPTYFPAISKKEIRDPDNTFLEMATGSGYPRLLVSAYDYGNETTSSDRQAVNRLIRYFKEGSILMLDSGVFESYWREDNRWSFQKYRKSVRRIESDFYLSFDALPQSQSDGRKFRKLTLSNILKSAKVRSEGHCVPIIHGANPSQLVGLASELVPEILSESGSLAVSERELGKTISERCSTIRKLRATIDEHGGGILHLLGCGQPLSISFYSYSGADTFDSLDWALSTFDLQGERLIDISHFELLNCQCEVCKDRKIDPFSKVHLHNLLSYQKYSAKLHMMIKDKTLGDYLQAMTNKGLMTRLDQLN